MQKGIEFTLPGGVAKIGDAGKSLECSPSLLEQGIRELEATDCLIIKIILCCSPTLHKHFHCWVTCCPGDYYGMAEWTELSKASRRSGICSL